MSDKLLRKIYTNKIEKQKKIVVLFGKIFIFIGIIASVITIYAWIYPIFPPDPHDSIKQGDNHLESRNYETAIKFYNKALSIDPDNVEVLNCLGLACFDLEQTESWNLRNANGENIAGGIYIFVVESEGKSGTGKFAVIK